MTSSSKKKWTVTNARGEQTEVTATRVEEDKEASTVRFFDGDEPVAAFRGFTEYAPAS